MRRHRIRLPHALADLGPRELEQFLDHRDQFTVAHPELADLLKRAGNEYLAIGWRMLFDANPPVTIPRRRRYAVRA